ncbi:MAG: site-specific integrase [Chitinophagaceae bacterium]
METKHSFAILSFIRKRNSKDTEAPVYLRITIESKRVEISTKTIVPAIKWVPGKGRVAGTSDEVKRLNASIVTFEHRVREIYNRFIEQGKLVTAESIRNELFGLDHKQHLLLQEFKIKLKKLEESIGCGYAIGTVKNWRVTAGHLEEFIKKQYKVHDIAFKKLKLKFLTDFDFYARTKWGCGNNAALKHITRIRQVVRIALSNDWLVKDPFMSFSGKTTKTNRTFLTAHELKLIETKEISIERLGRVRDVLVFCCYTGLAHVDVGNLTINNIVVGIDGKKWINTFRGKTNEKYNIPLLSGALAILRKYQAHPNNNSRNLLPVISNIKTNAYLKEGRSYAHAAKKRMQWYIDTVCKMTQHSLPV